MQNPELIKCTCCGVLKTPDQYYSQWRNGKLKLSKICKECRKKRSRLYYHANKRPKTRIKTVVVSEHDQNTLKTCTKCGETKSLYQFPFNKNYKDNRSSWCRSCCSKTQVESRRKKEQKRREKFNEVFSGTIENLQNINRPDVASTKIKQLYKDACEIHFDKWLEYYENKPSAKDNQIKKLKSAKKMLVAHPDIVKVIDATIKQLS